MTKRKPGRLGKGSGKIQWKVQVMKRTNGTVAKGKCERGRCLEYHPSPEETKPANAAAG